MMWGMKCAALLAVVATSMGGCSTFEGYPLSPGTQGRTLDKIEPMLFDALKAYSQPDTDKFETRNNLVRFRMAEIDYEYQEFEKNLHAENVRGSVYTDWATTALTAAVPAVSNVSTKDTLSGLATILASGKSTYDNKVLLQATMPALIAEMRARRTNLRTEIFKRMNYSPEQYDIYTAWSNLDDYYTAGTIPSAIASLNSKAGENLAWAERDSAIREISTPPPPSIEPVTTTTPTVNTTSPIEEGRRESATVAPPVTSSGAGFDNPPTHSYTQPTGNISDPLAEIKKWLEANPTRNIPTLINWLKRDPARPQVTNEFLKPKYESLQRQAIADLVK